MKLNRGGTKLSKFRNMLLVLAIALVMVLGNGFFVAQEAFAATQSGTVGVNNVPWTFDDETGALIIGSENNETTIDYAVPENHIWPWDQYKKQVKSVDFVGTVSVYNASWMFASFTNLESFDPTNLETGSATNMKSMFNGAVKLSDMRVLELDIPDNVQVRDMYNGCQTLAIVFWDGLGDMDTINDDFGRYIGEIQSQLSQIVAPLGNGIDEHEYPDAEGVVKIRQEVLRGYQEKVRYIEDVRTRAKGMLISLFNEIESSQAYSDLTDSQKEALTQTKDEGLATIDSAPVTLAYEVAQDYETRLRGLLNLMQAQNAAVAELSTTFNEIKGAGLGNLEAADQTTLHNLFEEGCTAIYSTGNALDAERAAQHYQTLLQNTFDLMIDKKVAVADIEAYRQSKNNDNYYQNEIDELDLVLSQAITDINNANAINAIEAIVTQAKADMGAVKTKDQIDFDNAKAALKAALEDAATLQADDYMDDSFAALTSAASEGQNVYNNTAATLTEIRDATAAIAQAKGALVDAVYVTFESNGGTPVATAKIAKGDSVARPEQPTKEGFEFDAWYKDNGVFIDQHNFGEAVNSNLTLYANWTKNHSKLNLKAMAAQ